MAPKKPQLAPPSLKIKEVSENSDSYILWYGSTRLKTSKHVERLSELHDKCKDMRGEFPRKFPASCLSVPRKSEVVN